MKLDTSLQGALWAARGANGSRYSIVKKKDRGWLLCINEKGSQKLQVVLSRICDDHEKTTEIAMPLLIPIAEKFAGGTIKRSQLTNVREEVFGPVYQSAQICKRPAAAPSAVDCEDMQKKKMMKVDKQEETKELEKTQKETTTVPPSSSTSSPKTATRTEVQTEKTLEWTAVEPPSNFDPMSKYRT